MSSVSVITSSSSTSSRHAVLPSFSSCVRKTGLASILLNDIYDDDDDDDDDIGYDDITCLIKVLRNSNFQSDNWLLYNPDYSMRRRRRRRRR
jgi:hypothetical protein